MISQSFAGSGFFLFHGWGRIHARFSCWQEGRFLRGSGYGNHGDLDDVSRKILQMTRPQAFEWKLLDQPTIKIVYKSI